MMREADIRKFIEIMDEWMHEKGTRPVAKNHASERDTGYTR